MKSVTVSGKNMQKTINVLPFWDEEQIKCRKVRAFELGEPIGKEPFMS